MVGPISCQVLRRVAVMWRGSVRWAQGNCRQEGRDFKRWRDSTLDLTYFSPKVEKRQSNVHGRGLFASEPVQWGKIVVGKGGYVMTEAQRAGLQEGLKDSEIQVTDDLFIGPTTLQEREGGMMHLNHSCDPNLGLQGQIVFVAMRDIQQDEELTFDYAMTDDEDYEMACSCGFGRCRGVVTGRDWMRPELQERYRGYFSWFIEGKIGK